MLTREWVDGVRAKLPELPDARRDRFVAQYGLRRDDAALLTNTRATADFFEQTVKQFNQPKTVANWMQSELFRLLKDGEGDVTETKITPDMMAELLTLIDKGTISGRTGKEVFEEMFVTGRKAGEIVKEKGLAQISDTAHREWSTT